MALRRHISCVLILSLSRGSALMPWPEYGVPAPMDDPDADGSKKSSPAIYSRAFAKSFLRRQPDNSGLVGLRHMVHLETTPKQY